MESLPNGAKTDPVQPLNDGRSLAMLTTPPKELRPNSVLWAPRTNSTWPTPLNSMFDELALNCGTPSMYVVTPGLFGLEPTPRKNALLSFRTENSLNQTFGA